VLKKYLSIIDLLLLYIYYSSFITNKILGVIMKKLLLPFIKWLNMKLGDFIVSNSTIDELQESVDKCSICGEHKQVICLNEHKQSHQNQGELLP
jgi:hypothetical protein